MTLLIAGCVFWLAVETGKAGGVGYCIYFSVLGTLLTQLGLYKGYLLWQECKGESK